MPQRTCIGCRSTDEQSALIRLVKCDDVIVEATNPRANGRGAYLHPACVALALRRKAIARAFGGSELSAQLRRKFEAMTS